MAAAGLNLSDDLSKLSSLAEMNVCQTLRERLLLNRIYTAIGNILIAVNPCQQLADVYTEEVRQNYVDGSSSQLAPHVYHVGRQMYDGIATGECQAVVISGNIGGAFASW